LAGKVPVYRQALWDIRRQKVRVTARRTKRDFAEQLRLLSDEDYPDAESIVLVVDNLNMHGPGGAV